ncbi:MAG TPA: M67 family metallopeptidase [Nitrososphaera sp.]|nr:M67 family metallopeptidase [Nitrososphaera sp.]
MQSISLTAGQTAELVSIAKDAFPDESCALLLGENNAVVEILPMRNIDESPVTFSMESTELMDAYNLAESKGLQVIAIFHSHPAQPSPSSSDIKFMEINHVVWLIYSTTEWRLKAYVYDDYVKEVTIKISARE